MCLPKKKRSIILSGDTRKVKHKEGGSHGKKHLHHDTPQKGNSDEAR